MFWYEHANIRKHVNEHSWSSVRVILSILAHLAHLAQSYFSLIFSAINTFNCFWFNLTNGEICNEWGRRLGEKWQMLTPFFLTAIAAITGNSAKPVDDGCKKCLAEIKVWLVMPVSNFVVDCFSYGPDAAI